MSVLVFGGNQMSDPEPGPADSKGVRRRTVLIGAAGALGTAAVAAVLTGDGSSKSPAKTARMSPSSSAATTPAPSPATPPSPPAPSVLTESALRASFKGYSGQVAFRPDGRTVAAASRDTGTIDLLDTTTGRIVRTFSSPEIWYSPFSFSPDGRSLATGGDLPKLWDVDTGRLVRAFPSSQPRTLVDAVALSPDGTILAIGGTRDNYCYIEFRDVDSTKTLGTASTRIDDGNVFELSFSPDGTRLAVGLAGPVLLLTVPNANVTATLDDCSGRAIFSRDGKSVFAPGSPFIHPVIQTDAASAAATPLLLQPIVGGVNALAVSPDGGTLAVAADTGFGKSITEAVWLWDIAHKRTTRYISLGADNTSLGPLPPEVGALAFSPDGKTLAVTAMHSEYTGAAVTGVLQMWEVG